MVKLVVFNGYITMDTCDKYNYLQKDSEKNIKNQEIL